MKKLLLCFLGLLAISATAQDDWERNGGSIGGPGIPAAAYPRTEPLPKPEIVQFRHFQALRMVGTNLFNVIADPRWEPRLEEVEQKQDGILILGSIARNPTYIAVTNYPGDALIDTHIEFIAMRIGTYDWGASPIALYDCGTPFIPPIPTPGQIAAAKAAQEKAKADAKSKAAEQKKIGDARALQANQDAAAKGDSYGLMRMGERYRDGDGVDKDLAKARDYLQKAADAGEPTAKDELSNLP